MNNQDFLFASLMGSKAVERLETLTVLQGNLYNTVLPPIPFLPFQNKDSITEIKNEVSGLLWEANKPLTAENQFFPLSFSFEEHGTKWLFPYEPLISVSGKNTIVKRKPLKGINGTIKEHWNSDDYEITITGSLIGTIERGSFANCYPRELMSELINFLTKCKFIYVNNPMLELLDIHRIVIEDYSFPFTKGENVQAYSIKALSDISYNWLRKDPLQAIFNTD
jgi:hypothetical protein